VFDFSLAAAGIPGGTLRLKIQREVSESGVRTLFDDTLDLSPCSGALVLDETDAGIACQAP
jgi:hypothetical protein